MRVRFRGTTIVLRICSVAAALRVLASGGRWGDTLSLDAADKPHASDDAVAKEDDDDEVSGDEATVDTAEDTTDEEDDEDDEEADCADKDGAVLEPPAARVSGAAGGWHTLGTRFMRHLMTGSRRTSVAEGRAAASTHSSVLTMFFMSSL